MPLTVATFGGQGSVRLTGTALHSGVQSVVELRRVPGPLRFVQRGVLVPLHELRVERADRGVVLAGPAGFRVDLVEHLLAAFGGLGVRDGVEIAIDAGELPLLDGGASAYVCALSALGVRPAPPALRVARQAELFRGKTALRFAPAGGVAIRVCVAFPEPVGEEEASWDGTPGGFTPCIAPARTFGWLAEHAALLRSGRARGVDLASVIVFGPGGPLPGCRPNEAGEVARHKLLDLVGDLAFYGGPPAGTIEATCPGHEATHALVREAIAAGVLVRRGGGVQAESCEARGA